MPLLRDRLTCVPGLESLLAQECASLGIRRQKASRGLVRAEVTTRQLYAANLLLRTCSSVLVEAASFRARSFAELELAARRLRRADLEPWLAPSARVDVLTVRTSSSRLYHKAAIAERLTRFFAPTCASPTPSSPEEPSPPAPKLLMRVEVLDDRVTLLLDSSGDPLHERSWRAARGGRMPLKHAVASGLLLSSGWTDAAVPAAGGAATRARAPTAAFRRPSAHASLLDPFCGSGSIPIEAALLATGMPPHACGPPRSFAFEDWPNLDHGAMSEVLAEVGARVHSATVRSRHAPRLAASDQDPAVVAAARANAERAGVGGLIEFDVASLDEVARRGGGGRVDGGGLLVTNPPWGLRSSSDGGHLRKLHSTLGAALRARGATWDAAVLLSDRSLSRRVAPDLQSRLSLLIGGQPRWLMSTVAP